MIAGQQPSAHQGAGPEDPRIAGVTAHGDGAQVATRARTWLALAAIVLIVGAVVLWWRVATGDDASAREAAAAQGIVVEESATDLVQISEAGAGFAIHVGDEASDGFGGYGFEVTPTSADVADGWPTYAWDGAEAHASWDPRATLVIDTGDQAWQVVISSLTGNASRHDAAEAFAALDAAVDFTPAP
ncbi:hypothetical protein [Demequina gelatinilytica]|uniref:hypothetical protein n=1 Tax=Demequina gelatinilytica TaxID=1638980 RepID=UPI000781A7D9|nr:hypothetical protein [Demequina gelatinilytica]